MTEDLRTFVLEVSEHFFHLTTECVRLYSNETRRHQTLASLVESRFGICPVSDYLPQTLRDHLSTIPTNGEIPLQLEISGPSADRIGWGQRHFGPILDLDLSIGDTLSIGLFHYVVSHKAARVLQRIGLDDFTETEVSAAQDSTSSGNVIHLR